MWNVDWEQPLDLPEVEAPPKKPSQSAPTLPTLEGYNPNNFQPGVIEPGARLDKIWWDHASQEERDAAGVGTWDLAKQRMQEWRARFAPEGDIGMQRADIGAGLATSGAKSWADVSRYLASRGIRNEKEAGKSWWNELKMGWEGTGGGGMHYDPASGRWTDTATSNLAVRGVPGAANFGARPASGLEGVLQNAGGGAQDAAMFKRWADSGQSSFVDGRTDWGGYFNRRPNGATEYYDAQGFKTDAQGQRIGGHAFTGSTADRASLAGMGGSGAEGAGLKGGGGGGGTGAGGGGNGTGGGLQAQVIAGIKKLMNGGGGFGPETLEAMKVQAKQRAEAMREQNSERVQSDLVRRGLADSPVGASLQAEAGRASDAQYTADATKIEIQSALQQHQDRLAALKMAQDELNNEAARLAQREGLELQKAQLALAQRRLAEEKNMLQMQLDARLRELGISNQFQLDMFERRLPLDIFGLFGQTLGGF
ncbi:MAG: hypothetical protein MUC67_04905 [Acidobacteria bacterium]|jgi:hypothetical protein|nr:hypothetical protein [Acidobacteriota bacterium]